MAVELIIALALVGANAFFVATEFAIARTRPTQVDEIQRRGRAGAGSVRHAIDRIDAYLAACQLGITISSIGLGAIGEPAFEDLVEPVLGDAAVVGGVGLSAGVAFAIITLLHVVVGELSPKSLAIARTERTISRVAPPMRAFYVATKPVVELFNGLGNLLLKPFGIPPAREAGSEPHTEDELRRLLRESGEKGMIEPEERTLAEHALVFGDRRVREVMVPRHEVQFVTTDTDLEGAVRAALGAGHTRLPLCEPAGLDEPAGMLHAKDLLRAVAGGDEVSLRELARPLPAVADATLLDELMHELRAHRQHLALVVDEHGTTTGLVTLEDVIEEIVGEIEDEFDPEVEERIRREDDAVLVDGVAPARLVAERLRLELDDTHEATIGGYVVERLGRTPEQDERLELGGRQVRITGVEGAHVTGLRFEPPGG